MPGELRVTDLRRADRALVVLSDIEMGPGGDTDDFPGTSWLASLLLEYNRGRWADVPLDVVFNGDTFDLLKIPVDGRFVHHVDAAVALAKMRAVIAAHPWFFAGIRELLAHREADRRVWFVVGNHDFELLFPEVQALIRATVGHPAIEFPGFEVDFGDVHIEHGSQADGLFRIEPEQPFIHWQGQEILNLPWAAVALVDVGMPLHDVLYPCDRARPMARVLRLLPEIRALLLDRYWQYWTRDWLAAWWAASDPFKQVSWTLFRQVATRLQSGDPAVKLDAHLGERVAAGPHRVVLQGHLHDPSWHHLGTNKLLRTGCMRDEFLLGEDGSIGPVIPKVYAEILLEGGHAFRSQLVEVDPDPGTPAATMPASILDVLERVRDRLAPNDTHNEQAAQLETESVHPQSLGR